MEISHKKVVDLTPSEYRRCYRLNYGDDGWMQATLYHNRQTDNGAIAILVTESDQLIGWGLLTPTKDHYNADAYGITPYVKSRTKYSLMLYVRVSHRDQGYGTILFKEAQKHDSRPKVWNTLEAEPLYANGNVTVTGYMRRRLNSVKRRKKFYEKVGL